MTAPIPGIWRATERRGEVVVDTREGQVTVHEDGLELRTDDDVVRHVPWSQVSWFDVEPDGSILVASDEPEHSLEIATRTDRQRQHFLRALTTGGTTTGSRRPRVSAPQLAVAAVCLLVAAIVVGGSIGGNGPGPAVAAHRAPIDTSRWPVVVSHTDRFALQVGHRWTVIDFTAPDAEAELAALHRSDPLSSSVVDALTKPTPKLWSMVIASRDDSDIETDVAISREPATTTSVDRAARDLEASERGDSAGPITSTRVTLPAGRAMKLSFRVNHARSFGETDYVLVHNGSEVVVHFLGFTHDLSIMQPDTWMQHFRLL